MSDVLLASAHEPTGDLLRLAGGAGAVTWARLPGGATSLTLARALAAAAGEVGADVVVLPGGRAAAEVAALLAHRLGAGLVIDAATLERTDEGVVAGKRELGGTWQVRALARGPVVVLAQPEPGEGEVPEVAATLDLAADGGSLPEVSADRDVQVIARRAVERTGVGVGEAHTVVAAGRGLHGDLTSVRELADALGGAVGATRDIVEEDWIGHEAMVGQTGVMIAPRLYIGAGISGAPHHVLGMRAAENIVAINTDPDAPLMELADLAIVGDAAAVLTEAARLVREHAHR